MKFTPSQDDLIRSLIKFAWPDISRGPASDEWVAVMRQAQAQLGWPRCPSCNGTGGLTQRDCCEGCYGTGYRNPDDL